MKDLPKLSSGARVYSLHSNYRNPTYPNPSQTHSCNEKIAYGTGIGWRLDIKLLAN